MHDSKATTVNDAQQVADVPAHEPYGDKAALDKEHSHAEADGSSSPPSDAHAQSSPLTATSKPSPLFSWSNFVVMLPNTIICTLYGYNIAVPGPYITMYAYATNCELYKARTACETLSGATCVWDATVGQCGWSAGTTTCYTAYKIESECVNDPVCAWRVSDNKCGNQVGYSSIYQGLFAAAMIIGAMVGSFAGGVLTKKLNYRLSFFVIGVVACIASVLMHVSTALFNYWLLFVARLILGVAMGWQTYATPSYTSKFADKAHEKTLGTLFQVVSCLGTCLSSVVGVALGDTIQYDADRNANVKGRLHGFVAVSTFLAALVLLLPLVTRDEVTDGEHDDTAAAAAAAPAGEAAQADDTDTPQTRHPLRNMVLPLFVGVCMAASVQLTGMLSVVMFAPTIMQNLGLDPLIGNFVVNTWDFVSVLCVIPLSRRFTLRTLFLFSTLSGSLSCLFLCGIPVYPGVSKTDGVKNGVAIAGIFVFTFVYLVGTGPCFFVLAIDVFPRSFRHIGSAVAMSAMFLFFFIVTFCYPIATEGISGGPSGNPDKGQAIAFIFFGCIGLVTVAIEYFLMHPWDSHERQKASAREERTVSDC